MASFPTPEGPDRITSNEGSRPPNAGLLLFIATLYWRISICQTANDAVRKNIRAKGRQDQVSAVQKVRLRRFYHIQGDTP